MNALKDLKLTFPNAFLSYFHVKNCFIALFYIISAECSFTAIIS